MKWFQNLGTMTKLISGFAALALLMAIVSATATSAMKDMAGNTEVLYEKHLKGLHAADELSTQVAMGGRGVRMTLLAKRPEDRREKAAQARQYLRDAQAQMGQMDQYFITPEAKQLLADTRTHLPEWASRLGQANDLAEAGKDEEALTVLESSVSGAGKLVAGMSGLRDTKFKVSQKSYEDSMEAYRSARQTMMALTAGGLVGGVLLGYVIARMITQPLNRCVEVLECTAKGDLSQRAEIHTQDELGRLAAALNTATESIRAAKEAERVQAAREKERADREAAAERERHEREAAVERERQEREAAAAAELRRKASAIQETIQALAAGDFTASVPDLGSDDMGQMARSLNEAVLSVRTAMEGVREVSVQLADASSQLSSASEEISSGAQEQASSLEETASSLQEITATVKQSADNAQQARQLASGSKEVAERGGQVVSGAVEAMSEINASSKKIADIITTIDEIAFQTNLLALNAAVEAARAGEQGRGFAVVATEVRNLAQRSATAAKEIKGLIQDSVKKVDAGTELVNKSGDTLAEIVTSVKRVTDIVTEMAAASKEQSSGIEQVNKAVSQMDSVTQRNASQTEEMSATAQSLTDQAGQLRDLVGRFKLSHGGSAPASRPAKRPAGPKPRPAVAKALKRSTNGSSNGNGHGGGHELDAMGDGFSDF
ncbi:methyl-accepting chemotaxis protein [Gemmata sp. JC717]|uniref:methyl-accepting chemotaxis protein n=1 Tax=Gemmata algarum TaxID=2975278 RepID=UPI0021BADEA3|nr:methyl-accepting chemotaxis protein [Gemmata algarum]MDY3552428.1 methyl-accepting chemotaxis protein [Gemmata algarum]